MKCACGKEISFVEKVDVSIYQTECSCGAVYQKKTSGSNVYITKNKGDDWFCVTCNSEIQGIEVAHPIHDGTFALSGSGRVHRETVPYCPKCESVPSFHGSFITPKGE